MLNRLTVAALIAAMGIAGCSLAGTTQDAAGQSRGALIQVKQSPLPSVWAQFPIPSAASVPFGIAQGPDKNIWFAESAAGKIGRITPLGVVTEFPLPSGVNPVSIARSGSGRLWFTATGSAGQGIVGSISTAGVVKTYLTPTAASGPYAIASGPDGNMWFTEKTASAIGVITPAGAIAEYPTITPNAAPAGISKGSDGALWFAESGAQRMGRISTSGVVSEFTGPTQPMFTTLGKDGNIWFGDMATHSIGRIKPSGAVAEFSISSTAQPSGVVSNGGSVWYVDQSAVALQYISPPTLAFSGTFLIPGTSPSPQLLAFGGDGNIWITEPGSNSIGVYDLHPQTVTPSSIDFTAAGQTQSFSISENNYSGEFTVSGCSSQVATVSPTGPATSFTATAVAAGTCTLTVSDTMNNSTLVSVTVTTTNFGIQ